MLVHHRDEDRSNNDPANLQPLCKRCHQLLHNCANNLPARVVFRERSCSSCGDAFTPTGARQLRCKGCGTTKA